jgi:hypothetical protein
MAIVYHNFQVIVDDDDSGVLAFNITFSNEGNIFNVEYYFHNVGMVNSYRTFRLTGANHMVNMFDNRLYSLPMIYSKIVSFNNPILH